MRLHSRGHLLILAVALGSVLLSSIPTSTATGGPTLNSTPAHRVIDSRCAGTPGDPRSNTADCTHPHPTSTDGLANSATLFAWSEVAPALPINGSGSGLASDANDSEAVQFGGETPDGPTNATLLYNESTDRWTTVPTGGPPLSPAPKPRAEFGFASNPADATAILFGGSLGGSPDVDTNDTWVFHFSTRTWTNVSGPIAPAPRQAPAFAVDPTAGVALLFGGWDPNYQGTGQVTFSDSWELNLTTYAWTRVAVDAAIAPPAVHGAGLVWDVQDGTFDLFGGCYPCSDAIWQFSAANRSWSEIVSPNGVSPSPRMQAVWVYDPAVPADLLFGGTDGSATFNDLYAYLPADNDWVSEATPASPPPRADASADWLNVVGNSTMLLTGGLDGNQSYEGTWRLGLSGNVIVAVENASDGGPISGALVGSNLANTLTTNTQGEVEFLGLPSAELLVNVSAPGYSSVNATRWVQPGVTQTIVVSLHWVPPATVDTFVTSNGVSPLPGAFVNLSVAGKEFGPSGVTGDTGWSNTSDVPAFVGVVTAWANGFHANSTRVPFASGAVTVVNLTLTPLLVLDVTVLGALPDGTRAPLLNATVTVNNYFLGITDATGYLAAPTSYLGRDAVGASAPYFAENETLVSLLATGVVPVGLLLTSAPPGYLDATVLDSQTHTLVPNVHFNFTQTPALPVGPITFERLAMGGNLLETLAAGNYSLTAWAPGFTENHDVPLQWIQPGLIDPLTVLLTPVPLATLDTLVLDNSTHQPIRGANVTLEGPSTLTGLSNLAGWANFSSLAAAGYTVIASAPGYATNVTGVALTPGEDRARFPINLTREGVPTGPGGANDLSLLAPGSGSIGALLLLPLGALALAVIYLTMLRAPEAAPPEPVETAEPLPPSRLRRWLERTRAGPPPEGDP